MALQKGCRKQALSAGCNALAGVCYKGKKEYGAYGLLWDQLQAQTWSRNISLGMLREEVMGSCRMSRPKCMSSSDSGDCATMQFFCHCRNTEKRWEQAARDALQVASLLGKRMPPMMG